jgi:lipid A ethanolaminephosphotransferase
MKKNIDVKKLAQNKNKAYSQDNLFHTLLGLFSVETEVYDKKMDITHP